MTISRVALGVAAAAALAPGAGCGEDDRPATFSYLHAAILKPSCATPSCHSDGTAVADVRLHDRDTAYAALVGRACDGDDPPDPPPRAFVDPGSPERSRLLYLLRAEDVPVPMPPDRPLSHRDVELVERWILDGAACD